MHLNFLFQRIPCSLLHPSLSPLWIQASRLHSTSCSYLRWSLESTQGDNYRLLRCLRTLEPGPGISSAPKEGLLDLVLISLGHMAVIWVCLYAQWLAQCSAHCGCSTVYKYHWMNSWTPGASPKIGTSPLPQRGPPRSQTHSDFLKSISSLSSLFYISILTMAFWSLVMEKIY